MSSTSSCQQPLAWNTRSRRSLRQKLSNVQVFVAPNQWSFPLNLPLSWLGFPGDGLRCSQRIALMPLASGLTTRCWTSISDGVVREVAFFHKRSHTARDRLCAFRARRPASDRPTNRIPYCFTQGTMRSRSSRTTRQAAAGMAAHRCCLLRPSALEMIELGQAFRDALKAPDRSRQAYFGLFPFRWKDNWSHLMPYEGWTFVCAPILQTFILNQAPRKPDWADKVANWDFQRIVTCHSPIQAGPRQFRQAFAFLEAALCCELVRKWMRYPGRF